MGFILSFSFVYKRQTRTSILNSEKFPIAENNGEHIVLCAKVQTFRSLGTITKARQHFFQQSYLPRILLENSTTHFMFF
jgi:hypothetical protein